eukprot:m.448255 g.448255  ORF g.448255 m.448255 type:complete len:184 (+) comp19635_c0_seq1:51-602(+)
MKVDEHEAEICRLQNELNSLKTQGAGEDVDPKSPLGKARAQNQRLHYQLGILRRAASGTSGGSKANNTSSSRPATAALAGFKAREKSAAPSVPPPSTRAWVQNELVLMRLRKFRHVDTVNAKRNGRPPSNISEDAPRLGTRMNSTEGLKIAEAIAESAVARTADLAKQLNSLTDELDAMAKST